MSSSFDNSTRFIDTVSRVWSVPCPIAPVILRQRDHARERDHRRLAAVYTGLLDRIESNETPSPDMPVNTLT